MGNFIRETAYSDKKEDIPILIIYKQRFFNAFSRRKTCVYKNQRCSTPAITEADKYFEAGRHDL